MRLDAETEIQFFTESLFNNKQVDISFYEAIKRKYYSTQCEATTHADNYTPKKIPFRG